MIICGFIDIGSLLLSHKSLGTALERIKGHEDDDMLRDACIQRFEYTFERAWKSLKRVLDHRGITENSPRQIFRQAAREKLLNDPSIWFEYLDMRNQTAHVYDKEVAIDIFHTIPNFYKELSVVIDKLKELK